ncbi:hypothetical protein PMAYCL1PPCAC_31935, partial [Pristionchus mayeri]
PTFSTGKYFPVYISQDFLYPSLYNLYLVLIGDIIRADYIVSFQFIKINLLIKFSFYPILLQIILCGVAKCLIRGISSCEFKYGVYLFAIELAFDFGLLLFIVSISFNQMFLVLQPHNCFVYSNKIIQCIFTAFVWLCSITVMYAFKTPLCKRCVHEDGRLIDSCILDLFKDNIEVNNYGILTGFIIFIRKAVYWAYDVLPLCCVPLYAIAALALTCKRRSLSQSRRSDWKVMLHGLLIFVVYGIASLINYVLSLHAQDELTGLIAQFLIFLDVTTVLAIPLSVFLSVPALRTYPSTLVRRCTKGIDSRVFTIQ